MYNGIGLATVRGSATSGHISKNLSYIKPDFFRSKLDANVNRPGDTHRKQLGSGLVVNKDVIEHNRKHALEAEIYELQETLKDEGFSEREIEIRVDELRLKQSQIGSRSTRMKLTDTHEISALKIEENRKLKSAFGIGEDHVPGASFDPKVQEERRILREQERATRYEQAKEERALRTKLQKERDEKHAEYSARRNQRDGDGNNNKINVESKMDSNQTNKKDDGRTANRPNYDDERSRYRPRSGNEDGRDRYNYRKDHEKERDGSRDRRYSDSRDTRTRNRRNDSRERKYDDVNRSRRVSRSRSYDDRSYRDIRKDDDKSTRIDECSSLNNGGDELQPQSVILSSLTVEQITKRNEQQKVAEQVDSKCAGQQENARRHTNRKRSRSNSSSSSSSSRSPSSSTSSVSSKSHSSESSNGSTSSNKSGNINSNKKIEQRIKHRKSR